MRLHGLSKQLRRIDTFQVVLRGAHDRSLAQFSSLEDEDDFSELMSAPAIKSHTTTSVKPILPDFGRYKVDDLFRKLVSVMNYYLYKLELACQSNTSQMRLDRILVCILFLLLIVALLLTPNTFAL